MIRWFAKNDLAANLLLIAILAGGVLVALTKVPLEVEPTRELPLIRVDAPYLGASPQEIERQIIMPIEQALTDLSGVKVIEATCRPGSGQLRVRMKDGVDPKKMLPEVERQIRSLRSLPAGMDTIKFTIPDTANFYEVISVVVEATDEASPHALTARAFEVRDSLLSLPEIGRATVVGVSQREFAIRLRPEALRTYGISYEKVLTTIKNNSKESGAGALRYETGSVLVRPGRNVLEGAHFASIPIPIGSGETIPLGAISEIHDGFADEQKIVRFNGNPALLVNVFQSREQSSIRVAEVVKAFIAEQNAHTEGGFRFSQWDDESYRISGRLQMLSTSLLQGGLLVMVVLGLFLRPSLAFWVALGIPLSFAGGVICMPLFGITGNMMSLFAFILVLGIVVDDAIVTAENVYQHKRRGLHGLESAVVGTKEVSVPVIFGVLTTMVAFLPLYNFDGRWGNLAAQIPPVVIGVLLFSLIESKLVLPSHLKHLNFEATGARWFNVLPDWFNARLGQFSREVVQPTVEVCMRARYLTVSLFLALALACLGYWQSGRMGFQVYPAIDSNEINCIMRLGQDASLADTEALVEHVYQAALQLQDEFRDGEGEDADSLVTGIVTSAGGYVSWQVNPRVGTVSLELLPQELRRENMVENSVLVARLYELCGEMDQLELFRVRAQRKARGNVDEPESLEIALRGNITAENTAVVDEVKALVERMIPGRELRYVSDDRPAPRYQLEVALNEEGHRLGLSESTLSRQIKAQLIGTEVMRIPRHTGEVRVFLKFPEAVREDRYALDTLLLKLNNGTEVPLSTVADISLTQAAATITREDGAMMTKVIGAPRNKDYDLIKFAEDATPELNALIQRYPGLSWQFKGYLENYKEMRQRFLVGIGVLLFVIYVLLALPFNSAVQPLFVMLAIPFGIIGALIGHICLGLTPSYLSMFGMLALSGVVVNDSLVLIDTFNKLKTAGQPVFAALSTAVQKRFRPILLTSLTTFAGLIPLMFSQSMQAKFLVPMAVSLGFGILFATFVILLLLPAIVLVAHDIQSLLKLRK